MEGYFTGQPGICLGTLGPGATNLITGVAQANMDHMPLIVIIGQASAHRLHKVSHQNMDSVDMYKSVTKWATTIRDPDTIPEIIAKAFKIAQEGLPGAVLIELPEDIAGMMVTDDIKPIEKITVSDNEAVASHKIDNFLTLLAQAKRPILLAGDSASRQKADKVLSDFLAKTKIYAATTFMGKGVVSDRYPCSLHTVGMGMEDIAVQAYKHSDLVICVGYNMVEWAPEKWNPDKDKKIIHISVAPAEVDAHYLPTLELVGNINAIIAQINQQLNQAHEKNPNLEFEAIMHKVRGDLNQGDHRHTFPLKPKPFLHDLRQLMADEDILFSDVDAHKMWIARQYLTYQSRTCLISNGFCSMGGSMPSALAAKQLYLDKKVVALCGDGGFIMSIQALATAAALKQGIVVIVWVDDYYGLIKWKQEMAFGAHSHIDLHNPNLAKVADAYGCHVEVLRTGDGLKEAFHRCQTIVERPSVILAPIDYSENMKLFEHLKKIV